jgi:hypothetical protein
MAENRTFDGSFLNITPEGLILAMLLLLLFGSIIYLFFWTCGFLMIGWQCRRHDILVTYEGGKHWVTRAVRPHNWGEADIFAKSVRDYLGEDGCEFYRGYSEDLGSLFVRV